MVYFNFHLTTSQLQMNTSQQRDHHCEQSVLSFSCLIIKKTVLFYSKKSNQNIAQRLALVE